MVTPSPTRIRERIAQAVTTERARPGSNRASERKLVAGIRAAEVATTLTDIVTGTQIVRGDLTLEFQDTPKFILDKQRNVVGIDALVHVFKGGVEQRVDPHRICINPPALVKDGTTRTVVNDAGKQITLPNFLENPREAYLTWLEQSIQQAPNADGWNTRGTVTTVYADVSDGWIISANAIYALARVGSGLTAFDDNGAFIGQSFFGSYEVYENFLSFDTSTIPDSDAVSAVALAIEGSGDLSDTDFTLEARTRDWGAAVTTGDWVPGTSLSALTRLATLSSVGFNAAGFNTFTEDGTNFQSGIVKTGITYMVVASSRTAAGTTPTNDEWVQVLSANQSGTADDPKLDITHATSTSAIQTGTTISAANYKADIVAGGKTTIITLTGDTWVASGATFDAQRSAILQGFDSNIAGATNWNTIVRDTESVSAVVRTSDTVVTITWTAKASYDPTAIETITNTIPGSALTGGNPIVATPTFQVELDLATNTPRLDAKYKHFWGGR